MVTFKWYPMDRGDKQVLVVTPKHTLGEWCIVNKPGGGVGKFEVIVGDLPTPPRPLHRMLMVANVSSVVTMEGMFVVIVKDETRWLGVKPDIEAILAIDLKGHLDAMAVPS